MGWNLNRYRLHELKSIQTNREFYVGQRVRVRSHAIYIEHQGKRLVNLEGTITKIHQDAAWGIYVMHDDDLFVRGWNEEHIMGVE